MRGFTSVHRPFAVLAFFIRFRLLVSLVSRAFTIVRPVSGRFATPGFGQDVGAFSGYPLAVRSELCLHRAGLGFLLLVRG